MSELEELKKRLERLETRVIELELALYEIEFEEDPLESAHQMFVQSVRSQREGNA